MKRVIYGSLLLCVLAACKTESGAVLQILDSPEFEDDCSLSATPTTYRSAGNYDPLGAGSYLMTVYLENLTNDQDNPAAIPGDTNVKPSANDALLIGYDTCFFSGFDATATAYDSGGEGLLRDCDDVASNQRKFVSASGTVTSGGGTLAGSLVPFTNADLKVIFGDAFDPTSLAADLAAGTLTSPTNTDTRSAAWGDFPASSSAPIIVQIRARAKSQSGSTLRSNWFALPVYIQPGVLITQCSASIQTCSDGSSALQGYAFPDSTCGGLIPQGYIVQCEAVDECP